MSNKPTASWEEWIQHRLEEYREFFEENTQYTCSHCNGSTGEIHIFTTDRDVQCCPFCSYHKYVMTLSGYKEKYD